MLSDYFVVSLFNKGTAQPSQQQNTNQDFVPDKFHH